MLWNVYGFYLQNLYKINCNYQNNDLLQGHYTNHSLRATAATRLYEGGINEQLIYEKMGHKSTAVWSYKRTNNEQQHRVSEKINRKSGNSSDRKREN